MGFGNGYQTLTMAAHFPYRQGALVKGCSGNLAKFETLTINVQMTSTTKQMSQIHFCFRNIVKARTNEKALIKLAPFQLGRCPDTVDKSWVAIKIKRSDFADLPSVRNGECALMSFQFNIEKESPTEVSLGRVRLNDEFEINRIEIPTSPCGAMDQCLLTREQVQLLTDYGRNRVRQKVLNDDVRD